MVRQVRFLVTVEEISDNSKEPAGVQARPGRGGDEHASERTDVRERARGGANEAPGRINAGDEEKA
jgi:hypothetical protein